MAMDAYRTETLNSVKECVMRVEGDVCHVFSKVKLQEKELHSYIKGVKDKKQLDKIKKGFSDIGKGMHKLTGRRLTEKELALAYLQVILGAGQIVSLAICPGVQPLFVIASTALGYLIDRETSTEKVVGKVVEEALAKYEDDQFSQNMSGAYSIFRTDMIYMKKSQGYISMIEHGTEFLGQMEAKIRSLRKEAQTKEKNMLASAQKVLKYIKMYCFTASYRLSILQQLLFQSTTKGSEDKGLEDIIKDQLESMKSLFQCLTRPDKGDAVVMSAFLPSKYPDLLRMMKLFGLDFQLLSFLENFKYMRNDYGCYAQASSGCYVSTCEVDKLEKRGDKTRFTFKQIQPIEDNLFYISTSVWGGVYYMKAEATLLSYAKTSLRFEKGEEPKMGTNEGAIIKIIQLQNGKFLLAALPCLDFFINGSNKGRDSLHFSAGIENDGSLWQLMETL